MLVQLGHAPGTGAGLAWRQAIVGPIHRQIRDRLRVVKGVHHGDGLADALTGRRAGQVVRAAQVGGPVPGHGLGPGDSQAVTGARADQRQALHLAGPGRDRADAADAGQFRRLRRGQWPLRRQRSGWCGAMPGRANGGRVPARRRRGSGGCHRAGRHGRQCGRGQADRGDECSCPGPDAVLGPTSGLSGADGVTIAVVPVHGSIPPLTHGAPRDQQERPDEPAAGLPSAAPPLGASYIRCCWLSTRMPEITANLAGHEPLPDRAQWAPWYKFRLACPAPRAAGARPRMPGYCPGSASGSRSRMTVPPSGRDVAVSSPPWARASRRAM